MANHNTHNSKKQTKAEHTRADAIRARRAAHELIESVQRLLPCEAMPIVASACGCSSVDKILRGMKGEIECPWEGLVECPLKRTPTP